MTEEAAANSSTLLTSRGWTLQNLIDDHENFKDVTRISAHASVAELLGAISDHERNGTPLVIEGYHTLPDWPREQFTLEFLERCAEPRISVRNIHSREDVEMSFSEFLSELKSTSDYVEPGETRRLYGKDYACPREWAQWLDHAAVLPDVLVPNGTENALNNLPNSGKVETLMTYIGTADTFTPFHKDIAASSGQNLMVHTSNEKASSFWFMTESSVSPEVTTYMHQLGQELALETHALTIEEFADAKFDIYVVEQKIGDLVLVPSRSAHQVVNHGGITVKMSWSRMTSKNLMAALMHELPIYHRVCKPEVYRVKATIYHSLKHLTKQFAAVARSTPITLSMPRKGNEQPRPELPAIAPSSKPDNSIINSLHSLLTAFDYIITEEFHPLHEQFPTPVLDAQQQAEAEWGTAPLLGSSVNDQDAAQFHDWHYTCDFCSADIFQSFFECKKCSVHANNSSDQACGFVICPTCCVEGRACKCGSMSPSQVRSFHDIIVHRNAAADALRKLNRNPVIITTKDISGIKNGVPVFQAAVLVQQKRSAERRANNKRSTRSCTTRTSEGSHPVPSYAAIKCNGCHAFKCLSHCLRQYGVHAVDVLMISEQDDKNNTKWHDRHGAISGPNIPESLGRADTAEKRGAPCIPPIDRLVKFALKYKTCHPHDPRSVTYGWYDTPAHTPAQQDDDDANESSSSTTDPEEVKAEDVAARRSFTRRVQNVVDRDSSVELVSDDAAPPPRKKIKQNDKSSRAIVRKPRARSSNGPRKKRRSPSSDSDSDSESESESEKPPARRRAQAIQPPRAGPSARPPRAFIRQPSPIEAPLARQASLPANPPQPPRPVDPDTEWMHNPEAKPSTAQILKSLNFKKRDTSPPLSLTRSRPPAHPTQARHAGDHDLTQPPANQVRDPRLFSAPRPDTLGPNSHWDQAESSTHASRPILLTSGVTDPPSRPINSDRPPVIQSYAPQTAAPDPASAIEISPSQPVHIRSQFSREYASPEAAGPSRSQYTPTLSTYERPEPPPGVIPSSSRIPPPPSFSTVPLQHPVSPMPVQNQSWTTHPAPKPQVDEATQRSNWELEEENRRLKAQLAQLEQLKRGEGENTRRSQQRPENAQGHTRPSQAQGHVQYGTQGRAAINAARHEMPERIASGGERARDTSDSGLVPGQKAPSTRGPRVGPNRGRQFATTARPYQERDRGREWSDVAAPRTDRQISPVHDHDMSHARYEQDPIYHDSHTQAYGQQLQRPYNPRSGRSHPSTAYEYRDADHPQSYDRRNSRSGSYNRSQHDAYDSEATKLQANVSENSYRNPYKDTGRQYENQHNFQPRAPLPPRPPPYQEHNRTHSRPSLAERIHPY